MYSRASWGGNTDPFILIKFIKPKDLENGDDPIVSLVMFEWQDKGLIGIPIEDSNVIDDVSTSNDWLWERPSILTNRL